MKTYVAIVPAVPEQRYELAAEETQDAGMKAVRLWLKERQRLQFWDVKIEPATPKLVVKWPEAKTGEGKRT